MDSSWVSASQVLYFSADFILALAIAVLLDFVRCVSRRSYRMGLRGPSLMMRSRLASAR